MVATSSWLLPVAHWLSGLLVLHARSWCTPGHLLSSLSLHCFLFVLLFYFLTSIHGTVVGVGVLLAVTLYLVCPTGVVAGVSVSLATHVFVLLCTHLGQ